MVQSRSYNDSLPGFSTGSRRNFTRKFLFSPSPCSKDFIPILFPSATVTKGFFLGNLCLVATIILLGLISPPRDFIVASQSLGSVRLKTRWKKDLELGNTRFTSR